MKRLAKLLQDIDRQLSIYAAQRPTDPDALAASFEQLRLEWTYHSNALEGNSLSLGETAFYLREGLTSEGKPLIDYLEARNHAEAIDWLAQVAQQQAPITEGFIKDLNALLHKGITERPALGPQGQRIRRPIRPGQYKQHPNHALTLSGQIHYYVEPLQVGPAMTALIATLATQEATQHSVRVAAWTHYEITRIHPFDDCNGRVARLLLNLVLMRHRFPPIVIKTEERRRYLESLEAADQGQMEPFHLFIAEHVLRSVQ